MRKLVISVALLCATFMTGAVYAQLVYQQKPGSSKFQYLDKSTCQGSVYYVDSGHSSASDATNRGTHPDLPFATLDYAVGRCTDNNGDCIYVMPGHNTGGTAAGLVDIDVAGIHVIGLGSGSDRPRFDFDDTDVTFVIGANGVVIENLTFLPSASNIAAGVIVEDAGDNAVIRNCEWLEGETEGTDEFASSLVINGGAEDVIIENNRFSTDITDNNCTSAINIGVGGSAAERPIIRNNIMYGNYGTAAITDGGTAFTEGWIIGNRMKVKDGEPGIELAATSTVVIAGNEISSTGVTCDSAIVAADGEWFENYCVRADGGAATPIGVTTSDELNTTVGTILTNVNAGNTALNNGVAELPVFVSCILSHDTVTSTAFDLTAASSGGDLWIDRLVVQNGGTAADSAGDGAVFEIYTNNVKGSNSFFVTTEASLVGGVAIDIDAAATTGKRIVLESGKKISVKATTEDFTSVGYWEVYIWLQPLTTGASVASANLCQ